MEIVYHFFLSYSGGGPYVLSLSVYTSIRQSVHPKVGFHSLTFALTKYYEIYRQCLLPQNTDQG